jgi:carbon monoxide dehydrogenase subunit G
MVGVSKTIRIDRPREAVFEYLDQPANHAEVTPSLAEAETVEQLDNGGKRARYVYEMAGISREGHLTETTHRDGERMVFELSGGITGEIDISFADADGGTEVTYSAEYDLPGRVLAAVAEPFVRRYNSRELETTLENLRTRLETDRSNPAE